ncbi:TPA: DUF1090 domain-containing protein [Salmonella enterica]
MNIQYYRVFLLSGLVNFMLVHSAGAADYDGCEYKRSHLEEQLEYAHKYNEIYRVRGLQRALRHVDENCSYRHQEYTQETRVSEKQRKVAGRQSELQEAALSGNREKISSKKAQLEDARQELSDARSELSRIQNHSRSRSDIK